MHDLAAGSSDLCLCGRRLKAPEPGSTVGYREVRCLCGARAAYEFVGSRWALGALLTPERSVPLHGFSLELRLEPDAERFWFLHPIGGASLPVHIVFSPSLRVAEIKTGDGKALRLEGVESVTQTRRIWVERREASRRSWKVSAANPWNTSAAPPRNNI